MVSKKRAEEIVAIRRIAGKIPDKLADIYFDELIDNCVKNERLGEPKRISKRNQFWINKSEGERVNQFKNVDLKKYNLPKITKKEDENKDNASKERR